MSALMQQRGRADRCNPRALLCEILGLSEDQARPFIAGEKDDHPEVVRALGAIQRFAATVREDTLNQLWADPSPQAAQR